MKRCKMKIITLIDNVVYDKYLTGEHGFSLLIEDGKEKILFDTGQSGNFICNAKILGIDISQVNSVVISHGHYDHTGGLLEFIKFNKKAKIYIKREAFYKKCKDKEFIGISLNKSIIEEKIIYTGKEISLSENITIIPDIKIYNEIDTHFESMFINDNNNYIQDKFEDEQFLLINNKKGLTIISGCSHRGISNIIKTATSKFNLPIDYVIGGFHLKNEKKQKVRNIINLLKDFKIKNIGVSHCTGIEYLQLIKDLTTANVFYNYTGNVINLGSDKII